MKTDVKRHMFRIKSLLDGHNSDFFSKTKSRAGGLEKRGKGGLRVHVKKTPPQKVGEEKRCS